MEEARYREAARIVLAAERVEQEAKHASAVEILAAAYELCLACGETRSEVEAAARVERALQERLAALLRLAAGHSLRSRPLPSVAPAEPATGRAPETEARLAVHCLGPLRVVRADRMLGAWPQRRSKAILEYLLVHRDRPVPKELLMELLWPEAGTTAARNNLNVAVHSLRRFLRDVDPDGPHVLFQDDCYFLNPELNLWLDAQEFTGLVAMGRRCWHAGDRAGHLRALQSAEALYQGELFEGDRYDDWILPLRRELADSYLGVLEQLRDHYLAVGDFAACTAVSRKILNADPCREHAHCELMRCYARQGHPHLALRQYHECRAALHDEIQATPSDATREVYQKIRRHEHV